LNNKQINFEHYLTESEPERDLLTTGSNEEDLQKLATRFWIKLAISKGQAENILKKLKERKLTP
jgi:hypothetical protein